MNGLTIFNHSLRQVLGNFGMAVRISWWLVLIIAVLYATAKTMLPRWFLEAIKGNEVMAADISDADSGAVLLSVAIAIAALVFVCWSISLIAIVWHRFILLEEYPEGTIPYRSEFQIGQYFWVGVGISLLAVMVVGLVSGFIAMIVGPFFAGSMGQPAGFGSIGGGLAVGILVGILIAVLYLRLALVLPALALGERLKMGQAWEISARYTGAIIVLAMMLAFINVVVPMGLSLASWFFLPGWLYVTLTLAYDWFYFMLNISILSTLYGHIVQKREVY